MACFNYNPVPYCDLFATGDSDAYPLPGMPQAAEVLYTQMPDNLGAG